MELLVFGHSGYAYLVPTNEIQKAREFCLKYEETKDEKIWNYFYKKMANKYSKIKVGYVLSGDIG